MKRPYATDWDYRYWHLHAESRGEKVIEFVPQQSTKAVTYEGRTGVVANRKRPANTPGDANLTSPKTTLRNEGHTVSPGAPKFTRKPYRNGPGLWAALFLVAMMFFRKGEL